MGFQPETAHRALDLCGLPWQAEGARFDQRLLGHFVEQLPVGVEFGDGFGQRTHIPTGTIKPSTPGVTTCPQLGVVITGNPRAMASTCVMANPSETVGSTNTSA